MNRDLSILICYASDRKTSILSVYVNDFLIALKYLNIINILKEILNQKYSIKDLREV